MSGNECSHEAREMRCGADVVVLAGPVAAPKDMRSDAAICILLRRVGTAALSWNPLLDLYLLCTLHRQTMGDQVCQQDLKTLHS